MTFLGHIFSDQSIGFDLKDVSFIGQRADACIPPPEHSKAALPLQAWTTNGSGPTTCIHLAFGKFESSLTEETLENALFDLTPTEWEVFTDYIIREKIVKPDSWLPALISCPDIWKQCPKGFKQDKTDMQLISACLADFMGEFLHNKASLMAISDLDFTIEVAAMKMLQKVPSKGTPGYAQGLLIEPFESQAAESGCSPIPEIEECKGEVAGGCEKSSTIGGKVSPIQAANMLFFGLPLGEVFGLLIHYKRKKKSKK